MSNGMMLYEPQLNRHVMTDPPIATFAHHQISGMISKIIGRPVAPTYAFGIRYDPGGHIPPHTDRVQNELSLSLSLGVTPTDGVSMLRAGYDAENIQVVDLDPNDGLLYRGPVIFHARDPVDKDYFVDQMIFGFRTINKSHCYCI